MQIRNVLPKDLPVISVSQKPIEFGKNICIGDIGASTYNLYTQVLIGAKAVRTEYVALCEDDCLYPSSHFTVRPSDFSYNTNRWLMMTWDKNPVFSHKGRCCLHQLISPTKLLVEHLEERFSKNHSIEQIEKHWCEPGRWMHEQCLGVTKRPLSTWESKEPCVVFFHPYSLNYKLQGTRKAYGDHPKVKELYPWGKAQDVIDTYWGNLCN